MKKEVISMLFALIAAPAPGLENWPRFRGENGAGHSETAVPVKFGADTLLWSAHLPGPGSSSPALWGERVFVTGEDREKHIVSLRCLDSKSGKTLWTNDLEVGEYHLHQFNNPAATSPAMNGDLVIVSWFSGEKKAAMLSAFDHDGKSLWNYEIGHHKSQHGPAIHPVIQGDRVVFCNLHMDGGFVGAVSLKTGKELWKTPYPGGKTTYVSPLIRPVRRIGGEGYEVIVAATSIGVVGLDLETGKEQWALPGTMKERCIVSPINVLVGSGSDDCLITVGCKNGVFFAVRPPVALEGDDMTEPEIAWKMKGSTPYVPTPVSDGSTVFALSDGGMLTALDAVTGEEIWKERLPANFYASPLLIGGKLYALSREGEMFVAEVRKGYHEIARSPLKPGAESQWSDATPIAGDGRIYIRLGSRLDCYGAR